MNIPEPQPDSPTWPLVLQFAKLMEHKLSLNRHKGDRTGWINDPPSALLERAMTECTELDLAIGEWLESSAGADRSKVYHLEDKAALEAADVANFAMMTADSISGGRILA